MDFVTVRDRRASGDRFEAVYREQRPDLVRLAYLLLRSTAAAEDVVHEAFIRLHRHLDEVENPAGFLRTATVRLCLSWSTRQRSERDRLRLVPPPAPAPAPETGLADAEVVWEALGRLSRDHREVLVLRYHADLSHAEIAALLACPVGTVRTRVHRGLVALRKEIDR